MVVTSRLIMSVPQHPGGTRLYQYLLQNASSLEDARTRHDRVDGEETSVTDTVGLKALLDERLPLNRKERFYTGTVFPMIVASDGFENLDRLLVLAGLPVRVSTGDPGSTDVQFFTEYGYAESRIGWAMDRLPTAPAGRDTPDILIYFEDRAPLLLALEAKMYDRPSRAAIDAQLKVQARLLGGLRADLACLGGEDVQLFHAALLPSLLAAQLGPLRVPVITWEALLDAYTDVAPRYWLAMLGEALGRYAELTPQSASGANSDAKLTGQRIFDLARSDALPYRYMGRVGGYTGSRLAADVASGSWRAWRYEVSLAEVEPNRNWFSVEAFLALIAEQTPRARQPSDD
jgi:hypothetical protein